MPLPFAVAAGLAALAGAAGVGVKKTIDAHKDNKEAKTYNINNLESLEKYLEEENI